MAAATVELKKLAPGEILDLSNTDIEQVQIDTKYCVTEDTHDEQVNETIRHGYPPITAFLETPHYEPVAICCSGPSLATQVEEIRKFRKILTVSGAHDFLIEHGIIPTWHSEADPRPHKSLFVKKPHKDVQYLIASCCHSAVFDSLKGYDVRLWHVLAGERRRPVLASYPRGHWQVTGGSNVGMRALVLARVLGYTNQHVFGMDCSSDERAFHVGNHPNEPKAQAHIQVTVGERKYITSSVFLAYAKQFFKETSKLPDVSITLHGDGLLQAISARKMADPRHVQERMAAANQAQTIALMNPETISAEYRELNRRLHEERSDYGSGGARWADVIAEMYKATKAESMLDYGSGKGNLARKLPFPCWEYDPAIPGKDGVPRPADFLVSTDVLEHIEPDKLDYTLMDMARCCLKVGYFVIHTGAAQKTLPDGRNTHLIQEGAAWWRERLEKFFHVAKITERPPLLFVVVSPKGSKTEVQVPVVSKPASCPKYKGPQNRWNTLEQWVNQYGWTQGAELGVRHGQTFLYLLHHCPSLHLLGVDVFEPVEGVKSENADPKFLPRQEARLRKLIAKCYPSRARLIKGFSYLEAHHAQDQSLDFVFIDADHEEASVRKDILAWRPKLKPGGMLCGHDLNDRFPGVRAAVADLCPGFTEHPDFLWAIRL